MSLKPCPAPDLTGSVLSGEPEVLTRRNVLYIPRSDGGADHNFGLYDETGRQILGNALFHGFPPFLKSQPVQAPIRPDNGLPRIERAIYGGAIGNHYGHFITECLNTLWYSILYGSPEDQILFHSDLTHEDLTNTPWIADFLALANIQPSQILLPKHPVTITQLITPGQAFSEDGFVYKAYAQAAEKLGAKALETAAPLPDQPVYLSRHQVPHGTLKLTNEDALIRALKKHNVTILSPETLPLAEQIAAFTRPVIGLIGSAIHTSILAPNPKAVILSFHETPRRSFPLMDASHTSQITYLTDTSIQLDAAPSGFHHAYSLPDPEKTASDLLLYLRDPDLRDPAKASKKLSTPLKSLQFHTLHTHSGYSIVLHRPSSQLFARPPQPEDVLILAITSGNTVFLIASDRHTPSFNIPHDTVSTPFLPFVIDHHETSIALRHPKTGLWLKAPPPETGLCLHGDACMVSDWERFTLKKIPAPKLMGSFSKIVQTLKRQVKTEKF